MRRDDDYLRNILLEQEKNDQPLLVTVGDNQLDILNNQYQC